MWGEGGWWPLPKSDEQSDYQLLLRGRRAGSTARRLFALTWARGRKRRGACLSRSQAEEGDGDRGRTSTAEEESKESGDDDGDDDGDDWR